jgi:hypothetical protein
MGRPTLCIILLDLFIEKCIFLPTLLSLKVHKQTCFQGSFFMFMNLWGWNQRQSQCYDMCTYV